MLTFSDIYVILYVCSCISKTAKQTTGREHTMYIFVLAVYVICLLITKKYQYHGVLHTVQITIACSMTVLATLALIRGILANDIIYSVIYLILFFVSIYRSFVDIDAYRVNRLANRLKAHIKSQ